jgi:arginine N-succinyltransferase
LVLGRVGQETRPAQHLLESIGFSYLQEVDPFDGGPHYGCALNDISILKSGRWVSVAASSERPQFDRQALVGIKRDGEYRATLTAARRGESELELPQGTRRALQLETGEKIFSSEV